MKTAVQIIIDIVERYANETHGKEKLRIKKAFQDVLCAIDDNNILETEKQQIIDAYQCGYFESHESDKDSETYYTSTFETNKETLK